MFGLLGTLAIGFALIVAIGKFLPKTALGKVCNVLLAEIGLAADDFENKNKLAVAHAKIEQAKVNQIENNKRTLDLAGRVSTYETKLEEVNEELADLAEDEASIITEILEAESAGNEEAATAKNEALNDILSEKSSLENQKANLKEQVKSLGGLRDEAEAASRRNQSTIETLRMEFEATRDALEGEELATEMDKSVREILDKDNSIQDAQDALAKLAADRNSEREKRASARRIDRSARERRRLKQTRQERSLSEERKRLLAEARNQAAIANPDSTDNGGAATASAATEA